MIELSPLPGPWLGFIGLLTAGLTCAAVLVLRRRARDARKLARSEARYRDLFEHSTEGLCTFDLSGRFTSFNQTAEHLTGFSRQDVIGRQVAEWIPPEYIALGAEALGRKMAGDEQRSAYDIEIKTKSGELRWLEVNSMLIVEEGEVVGIQAAARDITERRVEESETASYERQVRHSQKLESLGLLAGGIAHDFNNILVGIVGNASLLRADEHLPSRLESAVAGLETASRRAADLTRVMLDYSGQGRDEVTPLDLSRLVKDTSCLLEASLSKRIRLRFELQDDIPLMMADRAQLQQVVMNLITNASDAIGSGKGTIAVLTGTSTAHRRTEGDSVACEGVWLEVADDGEGMDAATRQRIFEPFFTTKKSGHGLGLASTLEIIRAHHGTLTLSSAPNKGTTFRLLFPASENQSRISDDATRTHKFFGMLAGTTVMVVDDEDNVRSVTREMLELAGCRVLCARDGLEALHTLEQHVTEVDLALLDLHMPELMGEELLRELRNRKPSLPVLFMSGALANEDSHSFLDRARVFFLPKPFDVDTLHASVARALESESTPEVAAQSDAKPDVGTASPSMTEAEGVGS